MSTQQQSVSQPSDKFKSQSQSQTQSGSDTAMRPGDKGSENLYFGLPTALSKTEGTQQQQKLKIKCPTIKPNKDPQRTMKALTFQSKLNVKVVDVPRPLITDPQDVLIRVTSTTVCGSDLHLYHNEFSGIENGDILGHEFMGIIEDVGEQVTKLKKGDRVVVSAVISCGQCDYCLKGLYSSCDVTNPSIEMEKQYGHRTSGLFGYSHLTGGYDGGQAEYVRVPLADINCLKVPDNLPDEKVLFLSDILCTGWHANVLGGVTAGCNVAIWGAGPVGLMAAMWAKFRGAAKIVIIDSIDYRLDFARKTLSIDTINFGKQNVQETIKSYFPNGPDVGIDCAGFRFAKTAAHMIQRLVSLETDSPEILSEAIMSVIKGGCISLIGDYYSTCNNFPIGAFMEKGMTMRGGQVCVQAYWNELLGYIQQGLVDPSFLITHRMPLTQADEAYKIFDAHKDNVLKILLQPGAVTGGQ